jgi:acrylyl-CoA reductase (NADPH)
MPENTFTALRVSETDGTTHCSLEQMPDRELAAHGVLVRVRYSGINYKDALAVTGKGKVIRQFPLVPGIDLAGEVVESEDEAFATGDSVIATGWGLGEQHDGGFAQFARLKAEWLLPAKPPLDQRRAMILGTAGFTAALSVLAILDHGIAPDAGPVLVTGAGGGVGGVSIVLLARLGFEVHAVSGREALRDYLEGLGAVALLGRDALAREPRPLEKETWAAAVDSVGGQMLATLLTQLRAEGLVAACGLAAGMQLPTTVLPFILRGVTLRGINSVYSPPLLRERAWQLLAETLHDDDYAALLNREITLDAVPAACEELLAGKVRGRILVSLL